MKIKYIFLQFFFATAFFLTTGLLVTVQTSSAQVKPLTLAQVMTGLQSKSGGFTLREKNTFITKNVREKGVTFRLTPEIERELRTIGASNLLIQTIRTKSARTTPKTPVSTKPNATYSRIWVVPNITDKGVKGIHIKANFKVFNLKSVKSDLVYRFQKNGKWLKTTATGYKTKSGQLSTRRFLTPLYSATVYEELTAFVPYSAFNLASGVHNLKMDADVIKRDGTMVKHLSLQNLRLIIPRERSTGVKGSAKFDRAWIDYGVRENGRLGMRIHIKLTALNLKNRDAYVRILFAKKTGAKLIGRTRNFRTKSGQASIFKRIRPNFAASNFNDIKMFVPYSEFGLPVGNYALRLHADLVDSKYKELSHLTFMDFSYRRRR